MPELDIIILSFSTLLKDIDFPMGIRHH